VNAKWFEVSNSFPLRQTPNHTYFEYQ